MSILDRYIVRAILGAVALVMLVLLVLGALATFMDQQDDVGTGNYTALGAFWYTMLNLPQLAYELLPITALIGSLLGLGSLARGSELTVLRAAGISIARLGGIALLAGLLLIGVELLLGELLAPALQQAAREQKAFSKLADVSFGAGTGAWVRDRDLILNVAGQNGESQFGSMQVFELSAQHRLLALGQAQRATAGSKGKWLLSGYVESRFEDDTVSSRAPGPRLLASNVSAGFLGLAIEDPKQLTSRALWRLISYYRVNSLDTREYVFAFWSRIARTVAIGFAVLLAIPFVLGALRSAGTGTRMMLGLTLGLAFFLLQRLIESSTVVFKLDPVLLAWLPTALLATVTMTLLARAR
ncbi:MAG TPA: LPS export ABC transporter permease LptG [Steroidobacteraceae bacterium]|nr:LPS export ABC transporter permease LptG [Steroidobacteraceae bacterium]